jgi:hypothetical protein
MAPAALEVATNGAADVDMTRHYHTFSTTAKHSLRLLHVGITPFWTAL